MLKKNKSKIILSSLIILLPMLFGLMMWKELPEVMTTHWGADGKADGFSGKAFGVFGLPGLLLVLHWVCLLATLLDKKQKEQNQKALGMIFWILPVISLSTCGMMYRAAFGQTPDQSMFLGIILGAMFVFMGNYFPKVKQNRTLGIKISWTLHNEENWNKTHRFAGKLWVACGVVVFLTAFLPISLFLNILLCVILLVAIAPILYSYGIYRRHQKEGIVYDAQPKSKGEKIAARISAVVVPLILLGVAVWMFTGNIQVTCGDTALQIDADYWTDITVEYSQIDTAQYRKDLDVGVRTSGFGSARLSMGIFQNEEFGSYTLYAYTGAEEFVVLASGDKTLVIGVPDAQSIYDEILAKIGG